MFKPKDKVIVNIPLDYDKYTYPEEIKYALDGILGNVYRKIVEPDKTMYDIIYRHVPRHITVANFHGFYLESELMKIGEQRVLDV